MNQTNLDDTLDVLNDLLQTSKDGEAGFHACAEDLRDPQLKTAMLEQSRDCAAAADELERIVLELGGKPKDSTSFAGDLHRRWVDLKSLVTGKDEEAVLNECERGEDVAKHRYQAASPRPGPSPARRPRLSRPREEERAMSQSLAFLLIGLATLVGFYDLWAFVSVFRSDRSVNSKALWSLLIAVLPVLGVLIWAVAGPRAATARPRA